MFGGFGSHGGHGPVSPTDSQAVPLAPSGAVQSAVNVPAGAHIPPAALSQNPNAKGYNISAASYVYPWSFMWFGAALCVMTGAVISFINLVISLEWVDALEMAYLFFFGLLLATIDTPFLSSLTIVHTIRQGAHRFVALLTRMTGKGVVYMFLGCTLWSSMWANLEGAFILLLAVILGSCIFLAGLISVFLGVCKSVNLNHVRLELHKHGNWEQMYQTHAKTNPYMGMTKEEFNKMAQYLRGVSFEGTDLNFVMNCLSTDPNRQFLTAKDLEDWAKQGIVFV
jgi:hypothetical protein